jgi:DNA polymerase III subunit chi
MMPIVAFHFNAPAKLAYACRLLRKAVASGSRVAVLGDEALIAKLDEQLWSFSALDFVAHARDIHLSAQGREYTPIWLCTEVQKCLGQQVLLNLSATAAQDIESFERVIEVVSQDEADRQNARLRWKSYAGRGIQIVRHDLNLVH